MHNPLAIANYFILRARGENLRDFSPARLHALVYLAHGEWLGAQGKPLLSGTVSAHRDGVFIPELREAGCWGTRAIEEFISVVGLDQARGMMTEQKPVLPPGDPSLKSLDGFWKALGKLDSFQLSKLIMTAGSPWDLIWNDEERPDDEPKLIPNGTIKVWFQAQKAGRGSKPGAGSKTRPDRTQRLLATPDPERLRSA